MQHNSTFATMPPGSNDTEIAGCSLCGSSKADTVCEHGQFGLPAHVVVCQACGFSYLSPRWTKARYSIFYAQEYDRYYRPEVISQNEGKSKYLPVIAIVERMKASANWKHFKRVLDIGSGMGHALIYLRDLADGSSKYAAIEPSLKCQENLRAESIQLISDDVDSDWDDQHKGTFDFVIMRHVVEHFHEPMSVLKKVRNVLTEDGLVYVAVPNAANPTRPVRSHFFRVVHISYFTPRSLKGLLNMSGFEVLSMIEGDPHDKHEVVAICRKGPEIKYKGDRRDHDKQMMIYAASSRWDLFHEIKSKLVRLLRRLHLIH